MTHPLMWRAAAAAAFFMHFTLYLSVGSDPNKQALWSKKGKGDIPLAGAWPQCKGHHGRRVHRGFEEGVRCIL